MLTIFLPLLIQVGLTLTILSFVPRRRIADMKADPTLMKRAALDSSLYSEASQKVANNFANQFQLPVLFYLACVLAILFGATGFVAGLFAWLFVGARIVHTIIHTTSNNVRQRFYAFALGLVALIGLWVMVVLASIGHPLLDAPGGVAAFA